MHGSKHSTVFTPGANLSLEIKPGDEVKIEQDGEYHDVEVIEVCQTGVFVDFGTDIIGVPWPNVLPILDYGQFRLSPTKPKATAAKRRKRAGS